MKKDEQLKRQKYVSRTENDKYQEVHRKELFHVFDREK